MANSYLDRSFESSKRDFGFWLGEDRAVQVEPEFSYDEAATEKGEGR